MPPAKKTPPAKPAKPTKSAPADPVDELEVDELEVDELEEKAPPVDDVPELASPRPTRVTLSADELTEFGERFGRAATIVDVAVGLGLDPEQLRATNIGVLDAEAAARGHDHSDNGRLLFAGTVITLPQDGG